MNNATCMTCNNGFVLKLSQYYALNKNPEYKLYCGKKCKNISVLTCKCTWCNNDFLRTDYNSNTMRMGGVVEFYCSDDCKNDLKQNRKENRKPKPPSPNSIEGKYRDLIIEQRLDGMTLRQIAEPLGVSYEFIRQILAKNNITKCVNKNIVERFCLFCDKPFFVHKRLRTKHCSTKCASRSLQHKRGPSTRELHSLLHCDGCGKWYFKQLYLIRITACLYKAKNKIQKNIYCSHKCYCDNKITSTR